MENNTNRVGSVINFMSARRTFMRAYRALPLRQQAAVQAFGLLDATRVAWDANFDGEATLPTRIARAMRPELRKLWVSGYTANRTLEPAMTAFVEAIQRLVSGTTPSVELSELLAAMEVEQRDEHLKVFEQYTASVH